MPSKESAISRNAATWAAQMGPRWAGVDFIAQPDRLITALRMAYVAGANDALARAADAEETKP